MKSNLYVIQDTKANRTTDPFSCPTDEVAKRNFCFGCFASQTPVQDCILWRVADFSVDDSDCSVFQLEKNIKVVNPTLEEVEAYHKVYVQFDLESDPEKGEF